MRYLALTLLLLIGQSVLAQQDSIPPRKEGDSIRLQEKDTLALRQKDSVAVDSMPAKPKRRDSAKLQAKKKTL